MVPMFSIETSAAQYLYPGDGRGDAPCTSTSSAIVKMVTRMR